MHYVDDSWIGCDLLEIVPDESESLDAVEAVLE